MGKPTSKTWGDGIPVEDVAAQTIAPPEMHSEPSSTYMGAESMAGTGEYRAHQRTYGDTAFEEPYEANRNSPREFRITPPEMHSHGPRDVSANTNPGKGMEKRDLGGKVTFGEDAPQDASYDPGTTT